MARQIEVLFKSAGLADAAGQVGSLGAGGGGGGGPFAGVPGVERVTGRTLQFLTRFGITLAIITEGFRRVRQALESLAKSATEAAERLSDFGKTRAALGSGTARTRFLDELGRMAGFDPASQARSAFSATQSGLGAAMAGRAGLTPAHELGTAVNLGERLEKLIDLFRRIDRTEGRQRALGAMRLADQENLSQVLDIPEETYQRLKAYAQEQRGMFGPEQVRAAAEFNAELEMFRTRQAALGQSIGQWWMRIETSVMKFFNTGGVTGPMGVMGIGAMPKALDAQTQALQENTLELRKLSGIYGGGNRARSAIPGTFGVGSGFQLPDALRAGAMKLGFESVGL